MSRVPAKSRGRLHQSDHPKKKTRLFTLQSRAPAGAAVVAFILGAVSNPSIDPQWALIGSFILLAVATLLGVKQKLVLATTFLLGGFFTLGSSSYGIVDRKIDRQPLRRFYDSQRDAFWEAPVLVEGRLRKEPRSEMDTTAMTLSVERLVLQGRESRLPGGLRVNVGGDERFRARLDELRTGDGIRLWASLRRPRGYGNPGAFDIAGYYRRNGVTLTGSVKSALLVERHTRAPWWKSLSSRLRSQVRRSIGRAFEGVVGRDSEVPGVVLALLIGDRSLLPPWASDLYQRAGTFHVMAISGAHVGLFSWLLYGALRRGGVDQKPALVFLFVALPMYASLCGGRPSVVRAVVMCLCISAAKLLSVDSPGLNGLALSALLLLAVRPMDLHNPGFQLSFLATCSILAFAGLVAGKLTPSLGRIGDWLGLSLAAQIGIVPILAWHFLRLTPAAVIANLVALPLAGALMVVGAAVLLFAPLPWIGEGTAWLAWILVKSLTLSSKVAVAFPWGSFRVPHPGLWWMLTYASAFGVAVIARGAWRGLMITLLALLAFLLAVRPSPPTPSKCLRVTAFDVGHGDSLLLELPGGGRLLVDGGGSFSRSFDLGEGVLVPALLSRGIRDLDGIVVTHADFDHIGGLPAVISGLRVRRLWGGEPDWQNEAYRKLIARSREQGVEFGRLREGDELIRGEVRVGVLNAGSTDDFVGNESSLILLVSYGRARLLLTGDAGASVETKMLHLGRVRHVDVLKVGHHGSGGSTTVPFLEAVSPRLALISAPSTGFLRLPSPKVLRRLRQRGIATVRTDRDGAITVSIDKHANISVETFRASRGSSF